MHNPTDMIAFVTPTVDHWLEREIAQWIRQVGSSLRPIAPCADALPRSYLKKKDMSEMI